MIDAIVWGTGNWYNRYKKNLEIPGLRIKWLVDKQEDKQGKTIDGWEIKSPKTIIGKEISVIIAVKNYEEIVEELRKYNFKGKLYFIDQLAERFIEDNKQEIRQIFKIKNQQKNERKEVIFDIIGGLGWAGTEIWAYNTAVLLQKRGYSTVVWGDTNQQKLVENYEKMTYRFELENSFQMDFMQKIADNLPCCYISNFWNEGQRQIFLAKQIFGDDLKIVQVLHCDLEWIYNRLETIEKFVDEFVCVSSKIRERCEKKNLLNYKKISHRIISYFDKLETEKRELSERVLHIGWAGRLEKEQKRADLLIEVIKQLECNLNNYIFSIAGDGEYFSKIEQYVIKNNLEEKVILKGLLNFQEMNSFWKEQDIFLNISSYEGCSLAMLEAMAQGCVPVVTDVSGVSDVVENHVNGIVSSIDDLSGLIQGIVELEENRFLLKEYSDRSIEVIMEKCNKKSFQEYMVKIIER